MYCANLIRPPDVESCNSQACEVVWITGEWTEVTGERTHTSAASCLEPTRHITLVTSAPLQCSGSCGQGYRRRLVSCSQVLVEGENYEYGHQSLSNCPGTPPESYMPCHLDPCPSPQAWWRVGIWGPVSEPFIRIQSSRRRWRYLAGSGQDRSLDSRSKGLLWGFYKCVLRSLCSVQPAVVKE